MVPRGLGSGCRIVELDGTQIKQDCIGKLRGKLPNMASEYEALLSTQQVIAFGDASYLSLAIVMPHWCVAQ